MDKPRPKVALARQMRRNLTEPEWLLWQRLKLRSDDGLVFKRQKPYGPYILDFYCFAARLAIEVDGGLHGEDEQRVADEGLFVYRVPAAEVYRNADDVADGVWLLALQRKQDTPPPTRKRASVPLPVKDGEVQG
jgi:very-short-patch-repair endonuclease